MMGSDVHFLDALASLDFKLSVCESYFFGWCIYEHFRLFWTRPKYSDKEKVIDGRQEGHLGRWKLVRSVIGFVITSILRSTHSYVDKQKPISL